mgnify:FL=1
MGGMNGLERRGTSMIGIDVIPWRAVILLLGIVATVYAIVQGQRG